MIFFTCEALYLHILSIIFLFFSFEDICRTDGTKRQLFIGTDVSIFTFNSSTLLEPIFKCHVELEVQNSNYGFSVFIGTRRNKRKYFIHFENIFFKVFTMVPFYLVQFTMAPFYLVQFTIVPFYLAQFTIVPF